jgi:hypothetical protein
MRPGKHDLAMITVGASTLAALPSVRSLATLGRAVDQDVISGIHGEIPERFSAGWVGTK